MAPRHHRVKGIGRYLVRCQALELGENGQAGFGVIQAVQQTRPLRSEQQTIELEGGALSVDVYTKFEAMSCFIDCLSQGSEPFGHNVSDPLGNESMLFCIDNQCTGKEIAAWQHSVFDEFEPVIAKSPHPLDSSLDLMLSRFEHALRENITSQFNYCDLQFFFGAKVDEQATFAHVEVFR